MISNERIWLDCYCIRNFSKKYDDMCKELVADLNEKFPDFKEDIHYIAYYLLKKKIIPSYNFFKYKKPDCKIIKFSEEKQIIDIFKMFFKEEKLTIYFDFSRHMIHSGTEARKIFDNEIVKKSRWYDELSKQFTPIYENAYRVLCILARIAEEAGAKNPYFTIILRKEDTGINVKGGDWKRKFPSAKYGKIVFIKYQCEAKEDLKELIDLSYNTNGEFEILRYKNPESGSKIVDGRRLPRTKPAFTKLPCWDCGAFAPPDTSFSICHLNMHYIISDIELPKAAYYAGMLATMMCSMTNSKKVKPLVSLVGCCDKRLNFLNLKIPALKVIQANKETSERLGTSSYLSDAITCIYKDERLYDAFEIKPGFDEYDYKYHCKDFYIDEDDPEFEVFKDVIDIYATQDTFKSWRYKLSLPLASPAPAYVKTTDKLFTRIIKAEKITKEWICGGWVQSPYLNFLRFEVSPEEKDLEILKAYMVDNFKLFPCISIKNNRKDITVITETEYGNYYNKRKQGNGIQPGDKDESSRNSENSVH